MPVQMAERVLAGSGRIVFTIISIGVLGLLPAPGLSKLREYSETSSGN
jgi:hypothetical protein